MSGLLMWILGVLFLTAVGLVMARRWLDKQDEQDRENHRRMPP